VTTHETTRRCPRCGHSMNIEWKKGVQTYVCGDSDCAFRDRGGAAREAVRRLGAWTAETCIAAALSLCRGDYQRALVLGQQRWSGSDLRGKAKDYGIHYMHSRDNLMARCTAAGIPWFIDTQSRGLLVLTWGH